EGPVFQVLDERPLVRPLGPSAESLFVPEVEQDDLATVVAQLEALAVLVHAFEGRRHLADEQMPELEQLCLDLLTNRAGIGDLLVGVLCTRSLEECLDLVADLRAILPSQFRQVVLSEQALVFPG